MKLHIAAKSRRTGEPYFTYRLVESVREAGRVRQRTVVNLGRHFEVPREQWPALARRIEALVGGQSELFSQLDARWGGEEFAVILPNCRLSDAALLAEKLRALIADEAFAHVGQVTSSFGVAEWAPQESLDQWIKHADNALYAAKAAGRNSAFVHKGQPNGAH
ncbi:putative diguanylate cyclase YdaM [Thiorhodovibrio litoralis]|uniref:GGDEF domain-containing protein n=1 Tax=Thiorhodovibrio TaxID=61593 RepID=UPI0019114C0C|nr:GGDEF domain-containing protein [Thiorhodovibrio litoralis]WPL12385.1 putative diguanylate cyclase YdaM [Thiorhodovibrio litoralis]